MRVVGFFLATAVTLLLSACADDRPPVSDGTGSSPGGTTSLEPSATRNDEPCTPGAWRVCDEDWIDSDGIKHCDPSIQYCKSTGTGWHPCGDLGALERDPPPAK